MFFVSEILYVIVLSFFIANVSISSLVFSVLFSRYPFTFILIKTPPKEFSQHYITTYLKNELIFLVFLEIIMIDKEM